MKRNGFTYIEILFAVFILGFALIPLLLQFYIGFQGNITAELVTTSAFLADELLEEIKSKRFDETLFPDEPVAAAQLGPDSGEDPARRATFDDVDDYQGWHESPPGSLNGTAYPECTDFTRSVTVEYVSLSGATWQHAASTTYYKRIRVSVSHAKIGDKVLETIISHH